MEMPYECRDSRRGQTKTAYIKACRVKTSRVETFCIKTFDIIGHLSLRGYGIL